MIRSDPSTYVHIRGSTLSLTSPVTLPAGTWSATAQVRLRSDSTLVADLDVTLTAPTPPATAHTLLLVCDAADQADWTAARHVCDVRFADADGVVLHTSRFELDVIAEVTEAPAP